MFYFWSGLLFIIICLILFFVIKAYTKKNKILWYIEEELSDEEQYKLYKENKERELKRQLILRSRQKSIKELDLHQESTIMGFIEPVGRWTRMIMNEYLPKITVGRSSEKRGFWQIRVTMQGKSLGKYKGRSR